MVMKKQISSLIIAFTLLTAGVAFARQGGAGGGGGGTGNYDCSRCMGQGGLGTPAHYICQKTEFGSGAGCQAGANGCTFTGGGVSLPDDDVLQGFLP